MGEIVGKVIVPLILLAGNSFLGIDVERNEGQDQVKIAKLEQQIKDLKGEVKNLGVLAKSR